MVLSLIVFFCSSVSAQLTEKQGKLTAKVAKKTQEKVTPFEQKQRASTRLGPVREYTIKNETDCISYYYHSNSGTALETNVKIYPDSLVWDYESHRFGQWHLRDKIRLNRKDFASLISGIQGIGFAVSKDLKKHYSYGGQREEFYFSVEGNEYCSFDNNDILVNGDKSTIEKNIKCFMEAHKTECQLAFKRLSKKLHTELFDPLPPELEKYRVNEEF